MAYCCLLQVFFKAVRSSTVPRKKLFCALQRKLNETQAQNAVERFQHSCFDMFCEPQHCDQGYPGLTVWKKTWAAAPNMPPTVTGSPITANIVNNLLSSAVSVSAVVSPSVPRDQLCLSKYQLKTNSDMGLSENSVPLNPMVNDG